MARWAVLPSSQAGMPFLQSALGAARRKRMLCPPTHRPEFCKYDYPCLHWFPVAQAVPGGVGCRVPAALCLGQEPHAGRSGGLVRDAFGFQGLMHRMPGFWHASSKPLGALNDPHRLACHASHKATGSLLHLPAQAAATAALPLHHRRRWQHPHTATLHGDATESGRMPVGACCARCAGDGRPVRGGTSRGGIYSLL